MEISVVIPAYNEEKRLPYAVSNISEFFNKENLDYEIIVVDDGSSDGTAQFINSFQKINPRVKLYKNGANFGKGYSVRMGVLNASGKYILVTDADCSTPVAYYKKLVEGLNSGYDIVIGSRGLKKSNIIVHQAIGRELMGKTFNLLVRFFMRLTYRDTQCGFKLFKNRVAKDIFARQKIRGFAFDVELLVLAKKQGARVLEYPVEWKNDSLTRVKIIKHPIEMLIDLLKIYRSNMFINK